MLSFLFNYECSFKTTLTCNPCLVRFATLFLFHCLTFDTIFKTSHAMLASLCFKCTNVIGVFLANIQLYFMFALSLFSDLLLLTVATNETDGFKRYLRSAKIYDLNGKVIWSHILDKVWSLCLLKFE